MPNSNRKTKMNFAISERIVLLRLIDVLSIVAAIFMIGELFDLQYFNRINNSWTYSGVLAVYLLSLGSVFEIYDLQIASNQYQTIKNVLLTGSLTVLFYILTPIYSPDLPNKRIEILFFFLAVVLSIFIWRMTYVKFFASNRFKKNAILLAESHQHKNLILGLGVKDPHYKVVGFISLDTIFDKRDAGTFLKEINPKKIENFLRKRNVADIIIASKNTEGITKEIYNQLILLLESGYNIREYSQVYEQLNQRIAIQYLDRDFFKYFPFSRNNQNQLYVFSARLLDIAFSVVGIAIGILLSPIIVLGNFFGNKGNLLYKQQRVGKNGEFFDIIKFRTMGANAEIDGAVFSTNNDIRVTSFGKFMRRSRIDEFPQFINILKGQMSIIGPRPERPFFVQQIADKMPFYTTRHIIKPGLTGWAQVNYPYGKTLEDSLVKLQYDLYYIKHRSIFLDINIMVKTFSTVLFFRGQ